MDNNTKKEKKYNRWTVLVVVIIMTFMATLDSSIVNVALPTMSTDLYEGMNTIEWVVTAYLIGISAFILIFGRLGDIFGKPLIFKIGIVLFTAGSLMCGVSNNLVLLVIARVIQAIGAAASMATNQGIITHIFPAGERGKALGLVGTMVALGTLCGPPLGGLIISISNWNCIFLINVPIGIFAFILALKIIPPLKPKSPEAKFDFVGSILLVISFGVLFGACGMGQTYGFSKPTIYWPIIGSLITLAVFIIVELNKKVPLLNFNIFRSKIFSIGLFCAFISFISIISVTFILPFYFQQARGQSTLVTALFMMSYPLILVFVAPFSGYLSDKIGGEVLTFFGLCITSTGLFLLSTVGGGTSLFVVALYMAVIAVGNGMFQSPNNSLVMSSVDKKFLGIAGSVNALVRNIGMVVGLLIATTILYGAMSGKLGYNVLSGGSIKSIIVASPDIFEYGMKWVYIVVSLTCMLGAVITAIRFFGSKIQNKGNCKNTQVLAFGTTGVTTICAEENDENSADDIIYQENDENS